MSSVHSPSKDAVRPSPKQSSAVLRAACRSWGAILDDATTAEGFPASCTDVTNLLHQTPSIPSSLDIKEFVEDTLVYLEGFSVWDLSSPKCDLAGQTKLSSTQKVFIGSDRPQFCRISNETSSKWPGFEDFRHVRSTGNYVFALVLGWSYVLSVRLVELRKESNNDKISYTNEKASSSSSEIPLSENGFPIPVGTVDVAECRWWAAILASGCGWQAVLSRSDQNFYPPWSCRLNHDERFHLCYEVATSSLLTASCPTPPTSNEAHQYLYNFAKLHNAYDQLLAAFIATLTIPEHGRFGAPPTLPRPEPMSNLQEDASSSFVNLLPSTDQLPHFMALSCMQNTTSCMLGCL